MGKSYSLDLRDRVVAFVEGGHSRRAASRHFGVSESFSVKLMQRVAKLGSALPGRQGRPPGDGKLAAYEAFLISTVETKPDITMPELSARLEAEHGVKAQPATLSRFLCRRPHARTSGLRVASGQTAASPGCGLSRTASSLSMRPPSPPKWFGFAGVPFAASGCPPMRRSAIGEHRPSSLACAAAS